MWRIHELKVSFIWFYVFGQTTYIPLKTERLKLLLYFSIITKCMSLLIFLNVIIFIHLEFHMQPTHHHGINMLINYSFVICFKINILTFFLNVKRPFLSRSLLLKFNVIIRYMENQLKAKVVLSEFEKKYRRKIMIFIAYEIIVSVARIMTANYHERTARSFVVVSYMYRTIFVFYITIFIKITGLIMQSLNLKIQELLDVDDNVDSIIFTMKQIKWIHFKLTRILKDFNNRFGWILFWFMMESFLHLAITTFMIFLYLSSSADLKQMSFLRNY